MPRILIADDEANLRATLARTLRSEGFEVTEARDGVEAVAMLRRGGIDAVVLDLSMPRLDGFGVLAALREEDGAPPVLVLTAHASLDNAVEAVRRGAFDFLEKPPSADALLLRLRRAIDAAARDAERDAPGDGPRETPLIGDGPAMRVLRETIGRVGPTPARVLITGESGCGKELVASEIHRASLRARGPLVRVNCAAVPEDLFEAELFGHVKGAFTGAVAHRRGRFERASGGTLFLDEIGEIPLAVQPKLLRALEEGEVERLGAEATTRVDVRVIAATNRDLAALVGEGRFREDLYYRLEVVTLRVPALRERPEDIPALARHFQDSIAREMKRPPQRFVDGALSWLCAQPWPGNVRQLRNVVERLAILEPASLLDRATVERHVASGVPPAVGARDAASVPESPPSTLADAVLAFERSHVARALDRHGGNIAAAARELGFDRTSLYKKLRALGLRD